MHLDSLTPLIKQKGFGHDPIAFHKEINIVFHNHEAKRYDKIHKEMWESLPLQYKLLINDLGFTHSKNLRLLDIGCGTGLSSDLLLRTKLGKSIESITLLDTSSNMLIKAVKRLRSWRKSVEIVEGTIGCLKGKFDIILISSVLHHIPDYKSFLRELTDLQEQNGILIIIHDPLRESIESKTYQYRCKEYQSYYRKDHPNNNLILRIILKLKGLIFKDDYIGEVNKELITKGVISEPLTATELWSVTDIHVEGLPYSLNVGISKSEMTEALIDYQLLSFRTYAFYGTLYSNLNEIFKKKEQNLITSHDQYGRNLSSMWIRISN